MEPLSPPSPFLIEQRAMLRHAAQRGPVVELACGRGRIALAVAAWGLPVIGIDRNADFLRELEARAREASLRVTPVRGDLESGVGLPLAPASCGAILVFRYLHRPLCREIAEALRPGGLLLYETFTKHQRKLGYGPGNPDFLLDEAELPTLFGGLEVLASWEGVTRTERPAALARLAARRPHASRRPRR